MLRFLEMVWFWLVAWWKDIFPPVVPPVPPSPAQPVEVLQGIIMAYNVPVIVMYPPITGTVVDAQIDAVDATLANQIAALIVSEATNAGLDIPYLAACINQESRFSPTAFNRNLSATYPTSTFERTDWGLCQFSGTFLPSKPGMAGLTDDQMAAKAQDCTWAIPQMAQMMAGNMAAAETALADATFAAEVTKINTTALTNAQFLATLYYNRGESGGNTDISTDDMSLMEHPFHVATWYSDFIKTWTASNLPLKMR